MKATPRYRAVHLCKGWYVIDKKTNLTVCGPVQRIVAEVTGDLKNRHDAKEKR